MNVAAALQDKLLVANRGEIAVRIVRAAHALGIPTVALYVESDAAALHVRLSEEKVLIGSYIDGDEVIAVGLKTGATLLHPGYGLKSEDHEFAAKVEAAGITWLGPRPDQIQSMGLKHEARKAAIDAGVPILSGTSLLTTLEDAVEQAERIGYPVMLKATGGGGGMGMEVCETPAELALNFEKTVGKALALFSNAGVFIEKYIRRARHIEVQVFGDGDGRVMEFGERECSVQRRHQKVLEEAGSPFIARHPQLGEDMRRAAVRLCELIQYRSAGTVEFIVDDETASFSFLELNSRIQVEHAVTEIIRPGLDLVALMIKLGLAARHSTPFDLSSQEQYRAPSAGFGIEARVYTEMPHKAFKPAPGLLTEVAFPSNDWLRVDTWVQTGTLVSPFFDPMVAKIIARGDSREQARSRLYDALCQTSLKGTSTNIEYLKTIVNCPEFRAGDVTTSFLDTFAYSCPCIEVVESGLATSVQDGRPRLKGDGIPYGGPMDALAFKAANLLAGNAEDVEALECTMMGPALLFAEEAVIGIAGAAFDISINGEEQPNWSRLVVPAGGLLEIGTSAGGGSRIYIAIRGGLPGVPLYMGSRSTYLGGAFGGHQGRDLTAGDVLELSPEAKPSVPTSTVTLPASAIPAYSNSWQLAAVPGPHADLSYLTEEDLASLFATTYTATSQSDRTGIRLDGLKPLSFSRKNGGDGGGHPSNTVDHGYSVGALNINGDTPVIFPVDSPDLGGFVCVLAVLTTDHWKLGQIQPGDTLRFVEAGLESVQESRIVQQTWLSRIADVVHGEQAAIVFKPFAEPVPIAAPWDGIIAHISADVVQAQPTLSFRQSSDAGVLAEVGEQALSFKTRAFTELWESRLREMKIPGLKSFGPGTASLLVRFDPAEVSQATIVEAMLDASLGLGLACLDSSVPSRRVHLPIVYDDSGSRECVERYMRLSGRTEAVYLPSNVEYMREVNSLGPDNQALYDRIGASDWFVSARAFFCGLPFLSPIDQRSLLVSQKYNPSRTFTPAGTVGYAGCTAGIYPIDSPGGYQILGKTLTPFKRWATEYEDHFLLRSFDTVRWVPVDEPTFKQIEADFLQGSFVPKIELIDISFKEIQALEDSTAAEVRELRRKGQEKLDEFGQIESRLMAAFQEKQAAAAAMETSNGGAVGSSTGTPLKSPLSATVSALKVEVGDALYRVSVAVVLEAMKTEVSVSVPRAFKGKTVVSLAVAPGDVVKAGQALFYCE